MVNELNNELITKQNNELGGKKTQMDDELMMDLMKWDYLLEQVSTGERNVTEILNVPSVNKQIIYNLTFTEHTIQLRENGETGLYLLDSLITILDLCTDKIKEYTKYPIVNTFIKQILKEWNIDDEAKNIFMKNTEELSKIDQDACPTLIELKTYEKEINSTELTEIVNTINELRIEKEDLEHNALKARVEMNYLNCNFHPMALKITNIEDADIKREKLKEVCEKCNDYQIRIRGCIKKYEILLNYDNYIYHDTLVDLTTRDNYKYNEYIRLLLKNGIVGEDIKKSLVTDLDMIENIEIIFINIIYLSNFIKKERLYTLNILKMYLDDINKNYLSDNCKLSQLKEELDNAIDKPKIEPEIAKVIKEKPSVLSYNDIIKNRIFSKINEKKQSIIEENNRNVNEDVIEDKLKIDKDKLKIDEDKLKIDEDKLKVDYKVGEFREDKVNEDKVGEDKVNEDKVNEDIINKNLRENIHNIEKPIIKVKEIPVDPNVDKYIAEATILNDAAQKTLDASNIDNPHSGDMYELDKLKRLRLDIENIIKGLNT